VWGTADVNFFRHSLLFLPGLLGGRERQTRQRSIASRSWLQLIQVCLTVERTGWEDAEARELNSIAGTRHSNNSAVSAPRSGADGAAVPGGAGTRGDASSTSGHADFVTRSTSEQIV
jgi:hypothetical protein